MIPSQAEQRAYLRRSVGHQEDTALISDSLLDDCLDQALREINQSFALSGVGSFQTVSNQQKYTPLGAGNYAITKVFYPADCRYQLTGTPESLVTRFMLSEAVDEFGSRRVYEPSIVAGFYQQAEYFYRLFGDGASIMNGFEVYLDPIPSTAGTEVYFLFTHERYATVTDIEDIHVQPYYAYAQAVLHEALAVGRGALTSVNSNGGVSMRTNAGSHHLIMADRMRKRYQSYLPVLMPGRSWP
tara:strand:- start:34292 stop:35017 length:726 start_codon:yes stop_codon:yes gene_type:complete